ncbi:MAG: DUF4190 domain-containing protein [Pseudomonadota bacterium]|nr:DUF4190 domain-containing protein [Pseudomonadota bacterium]
MSDQPLSRPAPTTSPLAVVSLVFGILGWTLLPFIGAVVAIVCGHLARSEIRRSHIDHRAEGDGMAVAGLVLGYSQLILSVMAIFMFITVLVFGMVFGHWDWH